MQQFDVYANPSKHTRKAYPYILDIQSDVLSDIATRIVVPLGLKKDFKSEQLKKLTPTVEYEGQELLIQIPQIASNPAKGLQKPIG